MSAFGLAWPKVTVAAVVLMAPLGALSGRRMRAIRRTCADATDINADLLSRLQDPALKISLGVRISIFFGIVLLMGAKPDLWLSLSIIGASVLLGVIFSLLALRRGSLSAPRAAQNAEVDGKNLKDRPSGSGIP